MQVTKQQADQLKRAYKDFGTALKAVGILEDAPQPPVEPEWLKLTAKQWGLLNALATQYQNGDVGADEWSRLGRQHGYDPRGLGGFFVGEKPVMAKQGARRRLTKHGERFIERWRGDFEA